MKWIRLGKVFCAENENDLMRSYGRMPTPLHLDGDVFRIYFESRNESGTASPYFLDMEVCTAPKVINVHKTPLLLNGQPGAFDDNGITPFSAHMLIDGRVRLYYAGWNQERNVPFRNAIGLAESTDGGITFTKLFDGPVLGQDKFDPIFPTGPCVIEDDGIWKMWYTSFINWKKTESGFVHHYDIKYRESHDGLSWDFNPITAIPHQNEFEYAFVCRSVIKFNEKYHMWYCFRGQPDITTYRIGYAESKDGITWIRRDADMRDFAPCDSEWDSDMLCYPAVFKHRDRLYMLYNGNGYGATGFGLAMLEGAV